MVEWINLRKKCPMLLCKWDYSPIVALLTMSVLLQLVSACSHVQWVLLFHLLQPVLKYWGQVFNSLILGGSSVLGTESVGQVKWGIYCSSADFTFTFTVSQDSISRCSASKATAHRLLETTQPRGPRPGWSICWRAVCCQSHVGSTGLSESLYEYSWHWFAYYKQNPWGIRYRANLALPQEVLMQSTLANL